MEAEWFIGNLAAWLVVILLVIHFFQHWQGWFD